MKRSKKLLALVLAMVMAFSLMAVTAAAYGAEEHEHVCSTETVQRRIPAFTCEYCGQGMTMLEHRWDGNGHHFGTFRCENPDCKHRMEPVEYDWWA